VKLNCSKLVPTWNLCFHYSYRGCSITWHWTGTVASC
jgi:hypothetical protein